MLGCGANFWILYHVFLLGSFSLLAFHVHLFRGDRQSSLYTLNFQSLLFIFHAIFLITLLVYLFTYSPAFACRNSVLIKRQATFSFFTEKHAALYKHRQQDREFISLHLQFSKDAVVSSCPSQFDAFNKYFVIVIIIFVDILQFIISVCWKKLIGLSSLSVFT